MGRESGFSACSASVQAGRTLCEYITCCRPLPPLCKLIVGAGMRCRVLQRLRSNSSPGKLGARRFAVCSSRSISTRCLVQALQVACTAAAGLEPLMSRSCGLSFARTLRKVRKDRRRRVFPLL